ncbi:MAG: exosome complex protein Rrp42 [Vulcanisaeta sp.]|nr:MAG: exonuclease [Vulcanisaeta sp. JCHS_4]MCG2864238.1 exosome complex protein Rrp42 [Vulcanisaeta sp.]PVU72131.1 exonuclease [Vulcanisaeta sp. SCGC AB-777_J10]MCG2865963.1 exosome complex protein Rrp42 [Vulcanisaeta sp.]MCG2885262.1 exosome complex protein Rrp42 [Vulcanisaeta sp.]
MLSVTQERGVIPRLKQEIMKKMVEQGVRIDGRGLGSYRELSINVNVVKTADGSSIVSLGNTKVIAGVKVEVGKPFEDTPDEGALIVNLEIAPTASPDVEPGPPDENSIEIARIVDRAIRHSGFLDFKSLSIVTGKHAWFLWVDIYVLNHDGNLVDAATIAAVAALMSTTLPKVELDPAGNILRIDRSNRTQLSLNIDKMPLTITHVKMGNIIIIDPTREEENLSDGMYVIGVAGGNVVAIQKVIGAFTKDEINYMINDSINQYLKLKDSIINAMKNPSTELRL